MPLLASIKSLYASAMRFAARGNHPRLAAVLILPVFRTLKRAKEPGARTIVILPKEGFTEDAMTALAGADDINVVALPRMIVKLLAAAFLPNAVDDNNYASAGTAFDEPKRRYRRFLVDVFEVIRRVRNIDGMITGNFSYATERELASAMEELGVPFIALHKENLKTPGRVAFFERVYRERRGPFTGCRILVYNEIERDLQIRAGVAEPSRIAITGMPRLDRMHAWRHGNMHTVQCNHILFFVFSSATGMPRIVRKGETAGQVWFEDEARDDGEISLAQLCDQTCKALLRIALDNPDIDIVIKSKGRRRDLDETAALFGLKSEADLPMNMTIVHGGDVLDLIADASVVCGFNSTALLEAAAAGKPVVMPWFAEAQSPDVLPYLIDLRGVAIAAETPEAMQAELVKLAHQPRPVPDTLDDETKRCLAYWTGNDDGHAAARTREAILRELR